MNSLSYISRQFDVLASSAIPTTPPSTPTGEHSSSPLEDGSAPRSPTMRRTRTWTSARSFFFPASVDTKRPDHMLVPPHERPRKRSGSTSSGPRLYQQGIISYSISDPSSSSSKLLAQSSEPNTTLAPAAEIVPPVSRIPRNSDKTNTTMQIESDRAQKTALRVLFMLSNWFNTLWQSLLRSLRLNSYRRVRGKEAEADMDTSDEKESDDDSSSAPLYTRPGSSFKQSRASLLLNYVLQPHFKPPTPPIGKASALPTPIVNLIPPDASDVDPVSPTYASSDDVVPSSSTLQLPASPGSNGSQTIQSSSTNVQQKTTPLHTRKTLVLDLDETLIHSTTRPLNHSTGNSGFFNFGSLIGNNKRAGHMVEVYLNGRITLYHVYKRPFVDYFLKKVSAWYTLVIFTASMQEYADPVIDWLDAGRGILSHRFFREHCKQLPNGSYSKDLSILKEDLARVCLVDNSPICYSINPANGIPIEGWTHDPYDEALLDLLPVLDSLRFTKDVRHVLGLRGF